MVRSAALTHVLYSLPSPLTLLLPFSLTDSHVYTLTVTHRLLPSSHTLLPLSLLRHSLIRVRSRFFTHAFILFSLSDSSPHAHTRSLTQFSFHTHTRIHSTFSPHSSTSLLSPSLTYTLHYSLLSSHSLTNSLTLQVLNSEK